MGKQLFACLSILLLAPQICVANDDTCVASDDETCIALPGCIWEETMNCSPCGKGQFSSADDSTCQPCDKGEYSDTAGADKCQICEYGVTGPAHDKCEQCGAHATPNDTQTYCNCNANYHKTGKSNDDNENIDAGTDCEINTYKVKYLLENNSEISSLSDDSVTYGAKITVTNGSDNYCTDPTTDKFKHWTDTNPSITYTPGTSITVKDNITFHAICEENQRTCSAGTYLPTSEDKDKDCQTCPADYYCPGFTGVYSGQTEQGLEQCPQYTTSAAGAKSKSDCHVKSDLQFCDANNDSCKTFSDIFGSDVQMPAYEN